MTIQVHTAAATTADTAAEYERFLLADCGGDVSRLRRRYRTLARQLHPDRGGVKELFQLCQDVYRRLLDQYEPQDEAVDMDWEPTPAVGCRHS